MLDYQYIYRTRIILSNNSIYLFHFVEFPQNQHTIRTIHYLLFQSMRNYLQHEILSGIDLLQPSDSGTLLYSTHHLINSLSTSLQI